MSTETAETGNNDRYHDVPASHRGPVAPGTIAFRDPVQKAIWDHELLSQLTSGYWENAYPHGHWRDWAINKAVVVDPENPGVDFKPRKTNYNLLTKNVVDVAGDRMLDAVEKETGKRLTMKELRQELRDMMSVLRTDRTKGSKAKPRAQVANVDREDKKAKAA